MKRKLRRINPVSESLYITLPKYLVDLFNLQLYQEVDVTAKGTKIIIETNISNNTDEEKE